MTDMMTMMMMTKICGIKNTQKEMSVYLKKSMNFRSSKTQWRVLPALLHKYTLN